VIRFWSQIVAFYFLQFINVWISVMMVLFHNTECGNKGNKQKCWLLLLLSIFPLDCIGLSYGAFTWWTNDLKNQKTQNRWTNSSTERIGMCACATERITPRDSNTCVSYACQSQLLRINCMLNRNRKSCYWYAFSWDWAHFLF